MIMLKTELLVRIWLYFSCANHTKTNIAVAILASKTIISIYLLNQSLKHQCVNIVATADRHASPTVNRVLTARLTTHAGTQYTLPLDCGPNT